jgi:uncharacterized membrane protein YidH (DUF202 family)
MQDGMTIHQAHQHSIISLNLSLRIVTNIIAVPKINNDEDKDVMKIQSSHRNNKSRVNLCIEFFIEIIVVIFVVVLLLLVVLKSGTVLGLCCCCW